MTFDQLDPLQRSVFKSASQIEHLTTHAEKTNDEESLVVLGRLSENCKTYSAFIEDLTQNHKDALTESTTQTILSKIREHCEQVNLAFKDTCESDDTA